MGPREFANEVLRILKGYGVDCTVKIKNGHLDKVVLPCGTVFRGNGYEYLSRSPEAFADKIISRATLGSMEAQAARLKADLSALIGSRQEATERLDAMLSMAPLEGGGIDSSPMPHWRNRS
jgi:hypothetical protein